MGAFCYVSEWGLLGRRGGLFWGDGGGRKVHQPVEVEWDRWAEIEGYEGRYEVSDHGRVRTVARRLHGRWGYRIWQPCIYKKISVYKGYSSVMVKTQGAQNGKHFLIHRLVARAFIGPIPDGFQVRHLDGNRSNNVYWNLAIGTAVENAADKLLHGTSMRGKLNSVSREDGIFIRESLKAGGVTQKELGAKFGVCQATISKIKLNPWFK